MTILLERIIDYFSRTYGYTPLVFEIIGPASMEKYLLESNWKKLLKSNKVESNSNSESFYTYLYEVDKNFRERLELRSAPKFILAEQIKELESTPFKEVEDCNLGDSRRVNRLGTILEGFFKNPGGFHQYFSGQGKSQEKAYYRFIDNTSDKVNIDTILGGHTRKTLCRMCGSDKLLCIGDGSDLNYNKIGNSCICLGDISTRSGKKYKGLHIHTLILCTSDGIFLGILQLACSAPEMRDPKDPKLPTNRPDEEKKSFIWIQQLHIIKEIAKQHPEKSFIYVCDREADMLSLYKEVDGCKNVDFIVRASQNRNIYHKHDMTDKIFDKIDRGRPIGSFLIKVNRQSDKGEKKGNKERMAKILCYTLGVELQTEREFNHNIPGVKVTLIHAIEKDEPVDDEKVNWYILTSLKIEEVENVILCINFYKKRWIIEEFHRVLKNTFKVEEFQLKSRLRLERAIAISAIASWHLMFITHYSRLHPNELASKIFTENQVLVLKLHCKENNINSPLTLNIAMNIIGSWGGYHKQDGCQPGFESLGRGFMKLYERSLSLYQLKNNKELLSEFLAS